MSMQDSHAESVAIHGVSNLKFIAVYAALYLLYMHVLWKVTGEFVYPIFDPIHSKHGLLGTFIFGVVLSGFVTSLGYAGVCLV